MSAEPLDKSNVLVMVPAFNEQDSVASVLNELLANNFQTLLISDGSTDATAAIGHSLSIDVLELPNNLNVGGALRAGFRFAVRRGFRAVVQVDADGQHPVEDVDRLITTSNATGAHMVIGSRFLDGGGSTLKVQGVRRLAMYVRRLNVFQN